MEIGQILIGVAERCWSSWPLVDGLVGSPFRAYSQPSIQSVR